MPRESITLRVKFSAAHRLVRHSGKCNNLHGHNYVADIFIRSTVPNVGPSGMVCDFAVVKEIIGGWINKFWDHKTILNAIDPMLWVDESLTDPGTPLGEDVLLRRYGHKPYVMADEPTAEKMAEVLLNRPWFTDHPTLRDRVALEKVTLFETDTCSATSENWP